MRTGKVAVLIVLAAMPWASRAAVKVCVETANQRIVTVTIAGGKSFVSNDSGKCQFTNYNGNALWVSAKGYTDQKITVMDGGEYKVILQPGAPRSPSQLAAKGTSKEPDKPEKKAALSKSSTARRTASVRIVYGPESADGAAAVKDAVEKAGFKAEVAQSSEHMRGVYRVQFSSDAEDEGKLVAKDAQGALAKIPGFERAIFETEQNPGNETIVVKLGPPLQLSPENAIVSGDRFTCVLYQGKVSCDGSDSFDPPQRIYGSATEEVPFTVPVSRIAAGYTFACAITTEGRLYCWGRIGTDWKDVQPIPIEMFQNKRFTDVGAAFQHLCAIEYPSAQVDCWGYNGDGQLGRAPKSKDERSSELTAVEVPDDPRFRSVSAGKDATCGITDDGDAYCWGTFQEHGSPKGPVQYLSGQKVKQVVVDPFEYGICAILISGTVTCQNSNSSEMPRVVSQAEFDRAALSYDHVIALDKLGQPWHWGYNEYLPEIHYPKAQRLNGSGFIAVGHRAPLIDNLPVALTADGKLVEW